MRLPIWASHLTVSILVIISEPRRRKDVHILLALAHASVIEILSSAIFLLYSAPVQKYYTSVIVTCCSDGTVLLWDLRLIFHCLEDRWVRAYTTGTNCRC